MFDLMLWSSTLFLSFSHASYRDQHIFLSIFYLFYFFSFMFLPKVIGGELQERLIPVPYSKSSTDQAVSCFPVFHKKLTSNIIVFLICFICLKKTNCNRFSISIYLRMFHFPSNSLILYRLCVVLFRSIVILNSYFQSYKFVLKTFGLCKQRLPRNIW